ncbi:MAG: hypothetical protein RLY84_291 [Actinomycetota bacterium]
MRLRALLLVSVFTLTGCSAIDSMAPSPTPTTAVEEQSIAWADCEDGFECAKIFAPLDWSADTGEFVQIQLMRKTGTESLPPILVNPGGPGSATTKWLRDGYDTVGTSWLRENFQVLAFDPRGVGESTAVECTDIDLKDEVLYGQSPYEYGSDEDLEYSKDLVREFAESCQQSGPSTAYFNTQQTARDMELIRILFAQEQLNFLGFSYGTELGATYAALFPDRVGKFILDGAVDPYADPGTQLLGQVKGFDQALRAYLTACIPIGACPFSGDVDSAMNVIASFLKARETVPLPSDSDRTLGIQPAIAGMIVTLYSQESWQYLSQAFEGAFDGDGTIFLLLADFYNDRNPDGGYYTNINEANFAISCADRAAQPERKELTVEIESASVVFGRYFSYPDISCTGWPLGIGMQQLDYNVELANQPLVIGTTGDPATPYAQAQALAELLGGKLLTLRGEGHTAYGSNGCVNSLVDAYLEGTDLGTGDLNCL